MKQDWINQAHALTIVPPNGTSIFRAGNRKVFRNVNLVWNTWTDDLTLADVGYTDAKRKMLIKAYRHEESIEVAKELMAHHLSRRKFASVGITGYNHFKKGHTGSKIASHMGPCLQSVVFMLLPKQHFEADVNYRSTEFYKKFPADLLFLHNIFEEFEFVPERVNMHFSAITISGMYYPILLMNTEKPIKSLKALMNGDPKFFTECRKWLLQYLCEEYRTPLLKHSQSMMVCKQVLKGMKKQSKLVNWLEESKEVMP